MSKSRYLTYIVIIVVSYNVVYNLADVMWTDRVGLVYASKKDFNTYMNQITQITGIIATVLAFLVSGNVIRTYGWLVAAMVTPIVWLLSSIGFFSGLVFDGPMLTDILTTVVANPANFILLMGSIQMCLGRSCKYTLFDETKEIAFIPLPKHEQRKGKAVVDGLASRLGKSTGSYIYLGLLWAVGSIANTVPYVTAIIFIAMAFWIYAVRNLGKQVKKVVDSKPDKNNHTPEVTLTSPPLPNMSLSRVTIS